VIKTVGVAARCVGVFFVLWIVLIFVFGILFRQLTDGDEVGSDYFRTVPDSMNTLLLNGLFPENESLVNSISRRHPFLWILIMLFILMVSLTLMHMLLAVLVELIGVISVAEKEGMTVGYVSSQFRQVFDNLDVQMPIVRQEFQNLLVEPAIDKILKNEGVDLIGLIDMIDIIYQDLEVEGAGGVTFEKFIDIILNMRGTNPATVKDVKEQLRIIKALIKDSMQHVVEEVNLDFSTVKAELKELKEAQRQALEDQGIDSDEDDFGLGGAAPLAKQSLVDDNEVKDLSAFPLGGGELNTSHLNVPCTDDDDTQSLMSLGQ